MKRQNKKSVGFLGEEIAVNYLTSLGYKIIERNFKKRYGEIDIIAEDAGTLVFIEVKTRSDDLFGGAEESITSWKIHSLINCADFYKYLHPDLPEAMRIDVVTVRLTPQGKVQQIKLFKNISG